MPKILGLVWDPPYEGRRLHQKYGWTDPFTGLLEAKDAINVACGDLYSIEVRELSQLAITRSTYNSNKLAEIDGQLTLYNAAMWIRDWQTYGGDWSAWPNGGQLHVGNLLADNNLITLINSGSIDEVWLATPPVPAPFEGCMLYPVGDLTSYATHDKKIEVPGLQRRCILHHPQMENWNLVHNYWHRVEAILAHIWSRHVLGYCEWNSSGISMQEVMTYAQLFTMTDKCRKSEGHVGSCHWMCNSKLGYVGDMDDAVPSGHHLWYDYPNGFPLDLTRRDRYTIVTADTWKGFSRFPGSTNEYVWQLDHIPRGKRRNPEVDDRAFERWTDWWKYIVDVNDETGYGAPSPKPTVGLEPPLALPIQKYSGPQGDKYIFRIAPHDGDPDSGGIYRVLADGVETHQVRRRQKEHNEISLVTVGAKTWKVEGPGWTYEVNGEVIPVQPMYTAQQLQAEIDKLHAPGGVLNGCPKPEYPIGTNLSGDYVLTWPQYGQEIIINEAIPLDVAVNQSYLFMYNLPSGLRQYCTGATPTPTPIPTPVPTPVPTPTPPTDAITTAFNKWRDARDIERKLWDEYMRSTES